MVMVKVKKTEFRLKTEKNPMSSYIITFSSTIIFIHFIVFYINNVRPPNFVWLLHASNKFFGLNYFCSIDAFSQLPIFAINAF